MTIFGGVATYYAIFKEINLSDLLSSQLIPPTRGNIYDKQGRLLASDSVYFIASLDTSYLGRNLSDEEAEEAFHDMASDFNLEFNVIYNDYLNKKNFIELGNSNNREILEAKINNSYKKFVAINIVYERNTIKDYGLYKILGGVTKNEYNLSVGVNGIEKEYDDLLTGKESGRIYSKYSGIYKKDPVNGDDIFISVDLKLQELVYKEVKKAIEFNNAVGGSAILYESKTGRVLAEVSIDTRYDWNVGLQGIFEPGSSIKPLIYAFALESNSITPESTFLSVEKIKPVSSLDYYIHNTDGEKFGVINYEEAIIHSCNVSTVQVAQRILDNIGEDGFYNELVEIGLGRKTGVDLPFENEGLLYNPKDWSLVSPYNFVIGQGMNVNLFQISRALNSFAADGKLFDPSFLVAYEENGEIIKVDPKVERVLFSENTVNMMIPVLESVVASGTGTMARVDSIAIGGKTGTAQKPGPTGYNHEDYYSIFWGFFPADNPAYSLYVMIDNPRNGDYFGGDIAAPAFKNVVEGIYDLEIEEQNFDGFYKWKIPDFKGYTIQDAHEICDLYSIDDIVIHGEGIVVDQKPDPGTTPSNKIELWFEKRAF
jgi:cell division protein FtsI (penicillin-binding protein 3)